MNASPARRFHIQTFGCQMNVNDSFWLARSLVARGFVEAPPEDAEILILNTCSVREKPELKVHAALTRLRHLRRANPPELVAVAGCVAQQIGAGFFARHPDLRLVLGGDNLAAAPAAIERLLAEPDLRLNLTDFSENYPERQLAQGPAPVSAYVNIMQGCDNFCAYCIVPYTRGRQKSRLPDAILEECRTLVEGGTREITLLGQNVNAYGLDSTLPHQPGCATLTGPFGLAPGAHADRDAPFAHLLRQVAALPGLVRLRFMTPHPKDFSPAVVRLFGEVPQLCPRLHLPLQAGSDAVLDAMGRRYRREGFMNLVRALRHVRSDLALSTDLIVGFPGETEKDFLETLDAVEEAGFMAGFSFCYSDRPGTAAERMLGKLPPDIKAQRLTRLQERLDQLTARYLQSRVDNDCEILLETPSRKPSGTNEESWQGRDLWGCAVNLPLPPGEGASGQLLQVQIHRAGKHTLHGRPLGLHGVNRSATA